MKLQWLKLSMTSISATLYIADGTHDGNIKSRKDKANGIIRQIMAILNDYSFGPYYFQVAIILRNSMLINATLCNSEVWYNLTEANLTQLESVDEILLRKILETGASTLKVFHLTRAWFIAYHAPFISQFISS